MEDLAGKGARHLWHARDVVVAVGDDQRAVEARARFARNLQAPALFHALGVLNGCVKLDPVEDAKIHCVGAEIGQRLAVRRVGRVLVGNGVILEARIFARGDEIGRVVDDAGVGRLVPQAADIPLALEAIEGDAPLAEGLGGGKPGRPGADNADLVRVALHIHASAILLPGLPLAKPS